MRVRLLQRMHVARRDFLPAGSLYDCAPKRAAELIAQGIAEEAGAPPTLKTKLLEAAAATQPDTEPPPEPEPEPEPTVKVPTKRSRKKKS